MNTFEKEYYESSAFWNDGVLSDDANTKRIKATIDIIPIDVTTLIDIGCGNGILINTLKSSKPDIQTVGIDRSDEALQYVKGEKKIGDILNLPESSNSYDCATCLQVLEHIPVNVYDKALSELARLTKKYLIVSVPYKEKIENNVTSCPQCKTIFNVDLHLRSYNEDTIENLFNNYGFKFIEKINVVKKYEYPFLSTLKNFKKALFPPKAVQEFRSPICPVCGFKNIEFKIDNPSLSSESLQKSTAISSLKSQVKNIAKSIIPRVERDGYWIIALYEKSANA